MDLIIQILESLRTTTLPAQRRALKTKKSVVQDKKCK